MTKFNPSQWVKIKANTLANAPRRLQINLVDSAALWIIDGKKETLAGYSQSFKLDLPKAGYQFKIGADGYLFDPEHKPIKSDKPTLTNLEKRAELSPAEIMVTRALREINRKEREMQRTMAEANKKALAKQEAAKKPEPDPEPETQEPAQEPATQEPVVETEQTTTTA